VATAVGELFPVGEREGLPAALHYFVPVLVDDVEGVAGEGPYFLFHAEDGLFCGAVGGVYAQGWGEGCQLGAHFVCGLIYEEGGVDARAGWRSKEGAERCWSRIGSQDASWTSRGVYMPIHHVVMSVCQEPQLQLRHRVYFILVLLLSILTYVRSGSALRRSLRNLASVCQSHWSSRDSGTSWIDHLVMWVR